ncbi:MAG: preprotein translocase subunit YajC [Clostridiales Family XIII bacterium]|jgi:preprotein translocase subunit YajC|nr:preprotein translocase subunit YajC [Clostridiales Family XIII bacterium]
MKKFLALVSVIAIMLTLGGCVPSSGGSGGSSGYMSIIMLVLIFAVMYFVMIRPQRKKQKEVEQMRSAVKPGDRITTIGGLKGKIVRVSDDALMIEVGPDKVRMEFMKWAVSKVDEKGAPKSKPMDAAKDDADEEGQEDDAPKTVKKPRRLGFKPAEAEESAEAEDGDADSDSESESETK